MQVRLCLRWEHIIFRCPFTGHLYNVAIRAVSKMQILYFQIWGRGEFWGRETPEFQLQKTGSSFFQWPMNSLQLSFLVVAPYRTGSLAPLDKWFHAFFLTSAQLPEWTVRGATWERIVACFTLAGRSFLLVSSALGERGVLVFPLEYYKHSGEEYTVTEQMYSFSKNLLSTCYIQALSSMKQWNTLSLTLGNVRFH